MTPNDHRLFAALHEIDRLRASQGRLREALEAVPRFDADIAWDADSEGAIAGIDFTQHKDGLWVRACDLDDALAAKPETERTEP